MPAETNPPPDDDCSPLMARAQDGDRAAYAALLTAIAPALRARCRRALATGAEAEDAVQDILLTVHRMRHTYDPARPFRPWLAAITQARIADRQRAGYRRARREAPLDASHETFAAPEANPYAADNDHLRAVIALLPPAERQAVHLLKLEELTLTEASARTGRSATALKVACHRAMRRLRAALDPAT